MEQHYHDAEIDVKFIPDPECTRLISDEPDSIEFKVFSNLNVAFKIVKKGTEESAEEKP